MEVNRKVVAVVVLGVLGVMTVRAQNAPQNGGGTHGSKTIRAVRTETPVTVDGSLDEPAWQQAQVSLGFVQKDPQEGEPSTERTEFRVVYTSTIIYIGVICYDSNPQGVLGTERRRDSELGNDDTLTLVLDTFHDHRNAYLFRTNPLGAQYDALITDEGKDINPNWDENWDVAGQINEAGWSAEFAIPFKSIRVGDQNGQGWGLDIERVIRRKNEFSYWNNYHRGFTIESLSQAGHLQGIEDVETGLRLRVKPYTVMGFRRASNPSDSTFQNASDAGIEVMKYRITPSLTADITWRTDFAQTEVDDQQVNLDRFPLFFPEKREFFQEGSGIFEFGIARTENPNGSFMKLFHSRQIGLSPRRQPVPIIAGGRITGRAAGFTLGMLNVQTEALPSEGIAASNYGVMRVKRDVLSRSTIGAFLINRESGGTSDFNRVYGTDANFVFFRYLTIGGMLGKSESPGVSGDNWVSNGVVSWNSDQFNLETSYVLIDPDFRDDMGFIPRKNIRQISPQAAWHPRPNSDLIRQFTIRGRVDYTMDQTNRLETRIGHYAFETAFQNGGVLAWTPHTRLDRPPEAFRLREGIVIPAGFYSWWNNGLRYRSNPADRYRYSFNWTRHFGWYRGGSLNGLTLNLRMRISEQFSVEPEYELNAARLPAGNYMDEQGNFPDQDGTFTDHVINTRVNYNFNNQWLTSTIIQYNSTDSFFGFNFRLNYIFRPGDDFFLVYNEGRRIGGLLEGQRDRSLQAKITYSFDF